MVEKIYNFCKLWVERNYGLASRDPSMLFMVVLWCKNVVTHKTKGNFWSPFHHPISIPTQTFLFTSILLFCLECVCLSSTFGFSIIRVFRFSLFFFFTFAPFSGYLTHYIVIIQFCDLYKVDWCGVLAYLDSVWLLNQIRWSLALVKTSNFSCSQFIIEKTRYVPSVGFPILPFNKTFIIFNFFYYQIIKITSFCLVI